MGFIDNILDKMGLGDDEEYYAEEFLDEEEETEEELAEEEPAPRGRSAQKKAAASKTQAETTFEDFDLSEDKHAYGKGKSSRAGGASSKVTSINSKQSGNGKKGAAAMAGNGMEVCVIKPTSVDDAREITETLLDGKTVVLNLEGLDIDLAQRIIDFTSGSCFAMRGNLQKISSYIFIITPKNVDIFGDFQDILNGTIKVSTMRGDL